MTNHTTTGTQIWSTAEMYSSYNTKNKYKFSSFDEKRRGRFSTIAKMLRISGTDDEEEDEFTSRQNSFLSAHRFSTSTSSLPNNDKSRIQRPHSMHANTTESFPEFELSKGNKRIVSLGNTKWKLDDEKPKDDKYFRKWMKKLHKGDIEKKAKLGFLTEDEVETLIEIACGTHFVMESSNAEDLKRLACFALAGAAFPDLVETIPGCKKKLISNGLLEPFLHYATDNVNDNEMDSSVPALTIHSEIKESEIEIIKLIAQGASGKVYLAKYKGKDVAVKIFDKDHISFSLKEFKRGRKPHRVFADIPELFILSVLQNEHFVTCYGGGGTTNKPFIVSEYMSKGPLNEFLIHNFDFIDFRIMLKIAKDVSTAMKWLHSLQIIHRDLKSMNILINDDMVCKIIDFGTSRMLDANKTMTGNLGTPEWIAPELFRAERYTEKADVYSFGIVMWEILTGKIPFTEVSQSWKIPEVVVAGQRPSLEGVDFPPGSHFYVELMKLCWDDDASKRPSFEELEFAFGSILKNLNEDGSYSSSLSLEKLLKLETVIFY